MNQTSDLLLVASAPPFVPCPRTYRGNMCGVRVADLPPVPGGASDPALVLSWFYDRYHTEDRARIRQTWHAGSYDDVLLSWPDSRGFGYSASDFGETCRELMADEFRPAVMLTSKDYDPPDLDGILRNVEPVLPQLVNVVPRIGIGFELNAWLSPETLHALIDALAPIFVAYGAKVYVHFTPGVASWQENGLPSAAFWNAHVGQLTGLWHQRIPGSTPAQYQYDASGCLDDVLVRFAGSNGYAPDSGFGHPFDLIALEITASEQFDGMSEAEGNRWGQIALSTRPRMGPLGPVPVMGSGNGE